PAAVGEAFWAPDFEIGDGVGGAAHGRGGGDRRLGPPAGRGGAAFPAAVADGAGYRRGDFNGDVPDFPGAAPCEPGANLVRDRRRDHGLCGGVIQGRDGYFLPLWGAESADQL